MEHTVEEVFDLAGEARLPFAPVSNIGDLVDSPHLKARGFFVTTRHPAAGELKIPGAPYIMPETPWELRTPAPLLGQHNDEVLSPLRDGVIA
jgi:crotonobetainyl-CoA:carnitine CoA-transferase CaiB-like acyl-CoA transferase